MKKLFALLISMVWVLGLGAQDLPIDKLEIRYELNKILMDNDINYQQGLDFKLTRVQRLGNREHHIYFLYDNGIRVYNKSIIMIKRDDGKIFHRIEGEMNYKQNQQYGFLLNKSELNNIIAKEYDKRNCSANILEVEQMMYPYKDNYRHTFRVVSYSKDCFLHSKLIMDAKSGEILWSQFDGDGGQYVVNKRNNALSGKLMNRNANCNSIEINNPDPISSYKETILLPEDYTTQTLDGKVLGNFTITSSGATVTSKAYYTSTLEIDEDDYETELLYCDSDFSVEEHYVKVTTYYYLNEFFKYYEDVLDITKDPIRINSYQFSTNPNSGYNGNELVFGQGNNYDPFGADLFHIAKTAADYVLSGEDLDTDVKKGVVDFLGQSYKWSISPEEDHSCFNYGGLNNGMNCCGFPKRYTNASKCNQNLITNREILSSILMKFRAILGQSLSEELVLETCMGIPNEIKTNFKFIERLFDVARSQAMEDKISCVDLAEIRQTIVDYFGVCESLADFPQVSEGLADMWIGVAADDTGEEPYAGDNIYLSPDIMNTRTPIKLRDEEVLYGVPNYLHVTVRNRGVGTCDESNLKLYWAKTNMPYNWPESFQGNEITEGNGIPIGEVLPGQSKTITLNWTDKVPLPSQTDGKKIMIYARIINEVTGEHGIAYNNMGQVELTEDVASINHLLLNIKRFNGIAAKSLNIGWLPQQHPNDKPKVMGGIIMGTGMDNSVNPPIVVNPIIIDIEVLPEPNNDGTFNPVNPDIIVQDTTFFEKGDLFVRPDQNFVTLLDGLEGGNPFTITTDGWIQIKNNDFSFPPMNLAVNQEYEFEFGYTSKRPNVKSAFSVNQKMANGKLIGSHHYLIEPDQTQARSAGAEEDINSLIDFNLSPNPVSDHLLVEITGDSKLAKEVNIIDAAGNLIKKLGLKGNAQQYSINVQDVHAGLYFVQLQKVDGSKVTKKIVIN